MPSLASQALASGDLKTTVVSVTTTHNHQAILLGLSIAAILLFLILIGLVVYHVFKASKNENGKKGCSVSSPTRLNFELFKSQLYDPEKGTKPRKLRTSDISKPKLLFGTGPFAVKFTDSNSWDTSNDGRNTENKVDDISNPFIVGDDYNEGADTQRSTWMTQVDSAAEIFSQGCAEAISMGAVTCCQPKLEETYRTYGEHLGEHAARHIVQDSVEIAEHIAGRDTGYIIEYPGEHTVIQNAQHNGRYNMMDTQGVCMGNDSTEVTGCTIPDDEDAKETEYSDTDEPTELLRDFLCDIITTDLISEIDKLASHFRELELACTDEDDNSGDDYDDQCLSDSSSLFGFDTLNTNNTSVTSVESNSVEFYKTSHQGVMRPACMDSRIKQEALESLCSSRIKIQRSLDLRLAIPLPFTRDPSTYNRATTPPYSCYVPFLPDNTETPELEQTSKQLRNNKPLISSPLKPRPDVRKSCTRRLKEALLPQPVSSKNYSADCANTTSSNHFVKKRPNQELRVIVHKHNIARQGIIDSALVDLTGDNPFADCYAYQSPFEDPVIFHPGMPACNPSPCSPTVVGSLTKRRETVTFKSTDTASNSGYVRRNSVSEPSHHHQSDGIQMIRILGTSTGASLQEQPVTFEDDDLLPLFPLPFTKGTSPLVGKPLDTASDKLAIVSGSIAAIAEQQLSPGILAYGFPSPPRTVEGHLRKASLTAKRPGNPKEFRLQRCKASTDGCISKRQSAPQSTMPTTTATHNERPKRLNTSPPQSPRKSTDQSCRRNRSLSDVTNRKPVLPPSRQPRSSPPIPPRSRVAPSPHSRRSSGSLTTNVNEQKRHAPTRVSPDSLSSRPLVVPNRSPTEDSKTTYPPKEPFRV